MENNGISWMTRCHWRDYFSGEGGLERDESVWKALQKFGTIDAERQTNEVLSH